MLNEFPWLDKVLGSILAFLIVYFILLLVRRLIRKIVADPAARYRINKRLFYFSFLLTIFVIVMIWAESLGSLTTMLGLFSAGLALALKDPISSIVGWFYIGGSKIFQLGDRIEVANTKGDVVDISLMSTTIVEIGNWVYGEQSTGRIIKIPNYWVFTQSIFNYTHSFPYIWTEIAVVITFESNWKKASDIMHSAVEETIGDLPEQVERSIERAREKLLIHYRKYTPIVYVHIADSGVQLVARFLTNVRQRRGMECEVSKKILDRFNAEKDIALAYTTYRVVK